jgi:hypothetical protein
LSALLICFSATTVYAQRNVSKKPSKEEVFFENIEKIKPGMSQTEVKNIMGKPYKHSFELNDDGELEENIFYQIENFSGRWTLLIYQCQFKNDKLVALKQKEYLHTKDFPIEL